MDHDDTAHEQPVVPSSRAKLTRRSVLAGSLLVAASATAPAASLNACSEPARPVTDPVEDERRLRFARSLMGWGRRSTSGTINIRGASVDYDTVVGGIGLKGAATSEPGAIFVYTAYLRRDKSNARSRPITFVWNGGPGAPSSYLNFSVIGPRQTTLDAEGRPVKLASLRDNPLSLLDRSDLVLVDPVGTGFSVAAGGNKLWDFYTVEKDGRSVADFIELYLKENDRGDSPLYLLGESYGTIRVPVVISHLQERDIPVAGGILVSSAADGNAMWSSPGHLAPYYLKFPNYAAVAWFHNRLPGRRPALQTIYQEAANFALNEFMTALVAWPDLERQRRTQVLARAEQLTGISQRVWAGCGLRLGVAEFTRELLGRTDVRLLSTDARQTVPVNSTWADEVEVGPTFVDRYYAEELSIAGAPEYRTMAPGLYAGAAPGPHPWDMTDHLGFSNAEGLLVPAFPNYLVDVGAALKKDRRLRIQQHSGLYDLTCASFQANWSLQRTNVPEELRGNFEMLDYESGHAVYMNAPSEFKKFADNLAAFYR